MKKILLFITLILVGVSTSSFSQITSAATGNWSAAATWTGGKVPTATDNVVIQDAHKVTVDSNFTVASITVGTGTGGQLLFSKTVACTLTVTGNITANAGATVKPQGSGTGTGSILQTIVLNGNFTFNGLATTGFNCRSGSATSVPATVGVLNFVFAGSTNTTLAGNFSLNGNAFNAITINKTGGAKVILANDVYILPGSTSDLVSQSILTFINGIVETGTNTLIHQTNTIANITGANPNSYVNGNFATALSYSMKTFPVGDAGGFRPITLKTTDSAGVSTANGYHWVTVKSIQANANSGSSTLSGGIDKVSSVRYYTVTFNKGTTVNTKLSFNLLCPSYGTDDGVAAGNTNLRVAYSTDARASWKGLAQTAAHTTSLATPPTIITPDSLTTSISVNDASSIHVALGRVTGTKENSLGGASDVKKTDGIPVAYELSQNYPNPFNPSTTISFSIPKASFVTLKVYDVIGKEVANIISERKDAGNYTAQFDAARLSSGVYLYRLTADNLVINKKMMLIK